VIRPNPIHLALAGALLLSLATSRAADTNPYARIWERNSFGLKAPPAPEIVPVEAPKAVDKITLTGFITLLDQPRATFQRQVNGGPQSLFSLAEGEKNEVVELLKIDEQADTVTIRRNGEIETMTFGLAAPTGPAAAPPGLRPPPTPPAAGGERSVQRSK
jgi:hypothetical protein